MALRSTEIKTCVPTADFAACQQFGVEIPGADERRAHVRHGAPGSCCSTSTARRSASPGSRPGGLRDCTPFDPCGVPWHVARNT